MSNKYCINCGHRLPEDAQYCPSCGSATPGHESDSSPQKDQEKEKNNQQKVNEIIKDYQCKKLSEKTILLFMLNYAAMTGVLPVLLFIGIFLFPIIFSVLFILYLLAIFIAALVSYNNFSYSLTETSFEKEQGLIHKQTVIVPYVQIQNINIMSTFIDRILGISRIHIESAGSAVGASRHVVGGLSTQAEAHLPGISHEEAQKLHDALFNLANKKDTD